MYKKYLVLVSLFLSMSSISAEENKKISILGEVNSPGAYVLADDQNIYDAIAKAGGFNDIANRNHIKIIRKQEGAKKKLVSINFSKDILAMDEGDVKNFDESIYQIKEGDLLYIGKSRVRQAGQVFMSALKIVSLGAMTGAISGAVN